MYSTFDSIPKFNDLFKETGFETLGSYVRDSIINYTIAACITLVYGLLHFLGGRIQFPTTIERDLWRTASVVVMSSGAMTALIDLIYDIGRRAPQVPKSLVNVMERIHDIAVYRILSVVYIVGSGYLLVESIRQLWYLPHDAFVIASWSFYIPHWL